MIFPFAILGDALTPNRWIEYFSSSDNRHALPLFTSLLNVVCSYDPVGMGLPYNHLIFTDSREALVEAALQVLVVVLDHDTNNSTEEDVSKLFILIFKANLLLNADAQTPEIAYNILVTRTPYLPLN